MKKHYVLIPFMLMYVVALYPVGAGIAPYRVTDQGVEFLMVKDPCQKRSWRKGFEFAAGTIGDYGHKAIDQLDGQKIDVLSRLDKGEISVVRYLRGAVREGLEELLFVLAGYMIPGEAYDAYGSINKEFEKTAIKVVVQEICNQGLIFLQNLEGAANYTIFFWNVTHLPTKNLLKEMQLKRKAVLSGWRKRVSSIGAEPDQFAWVRAQELQKVINNAQCEKNLKQVKGRYSVIAEELVKPDLRVRRNVFIKPSPAFVGLICKSFEDIKKNKSMTDIIQMLEKNH